MKNITLPLVLLSRSLALRHNIVSTSVTVTTLFPCFMRRKLDDGGRGQNRDTARPHNAMFSWDNDSYDDFVRLNVRVCVCVCLCVCVCVRERERALVCVLYLDALLSWTSFALFGQSLRRDHIKVLLSCQHTHAHAHTCTHTHTHTHTKFIKCSWALTGTKKKRR